MDGLSVEAGSKTHKPSLLDRVTPQAARVPLLQETLPVSQLRAAHRDVSFCRSASGFTCTGGTLTWTVY